MHWVQCSTELQFQLHYNLYYDFMYDYDYDYWSSMCLFRRSLLMYRLFLHLHSRPSNVRTTVHTDVGSHKIAV